MLKFYIARYESAGAILARLPALCLFMLSWIHSLPDKCMALVCTRERNLPSHPCCLPPPRRPLPKYCSPWTTQQRHPCPSVGKIIRWSYCLQTLRQATLGRRKLVVSILQLARQGPLGQVFVEYLVGSIILHVPGVNRMVVECQATKAEK